MYISWQLTETILSITRGKESLPKTVSSFLVEALSNCTEMTQLIWFCRKLNLVLLFSVKCCDLRTLSHFGEKSQFTHFDRHKILAPRRFQLFCTPGLECLKDNAKRHEGPARRSPRVYRLLVYLINVERSVYLNFLPGWQPLLDVLPKKLKRHTPEVLKNCRW